MTTGINSGPLLPRGRVIAAGRDLEYAFYPARDAALPALVFLHEGLGSVAMWRDFPARVAEASGCPVVVYSRYGYGESESLAGPHAPDYMHREARETLPALLEALGLVRPVLIGHSDGGSIALIHAGSGFEVAGLVVMAPHCFVEEVSVRSIDEARRVAQSTDLIQKLGRYHRDPRTTFYGWNDVWLSPDFRDWNIEDVLPQIRCPILAIQGEDDEYGTMAQIDAIAAGATGAREVQLLKLPACGHSPHRDQPEVVIAAIVGFLATLI